MTVATDEGELAGVLASRSSPRSPALVVAPLLLLSLVMLVVLRLSAAELNNQDTWFHLALGDRFRDTWGLGHPGSLSPFATSPWVPTQWSTQVLASLFHSWFGLPGVAWLFGVLMLTFVVAVNGVCRSLSGALPAAVATTLTVLACAPALSARPQVVSLVCLAVTVGAWLRTAGDGEPRWWLVPMTWLWATAHGLWSAGVLVGFVCSVGVVLDRRVRGRPAARLFALPVACLLVTALTPVGPRLLTSQLAVSARSSLIPEWGPTSFREVPALVAAVMIGWLVVLWVRRGSRVSWTRLLLMLVAGAWMLTVTRMVGPGSVIVAPLLAEAVHTRMRHRGVDSRQRRRERWGVGLASGAYIVGLTLMVPHTAASAAGVPTALEPQLQALPPGTAVLVEDGVGGWIEWRLPTLHPVIDGMLDAYPVDYIRRFFEMTELEPGWRMFIADSHAQAAVLKTGSPLSAAVQDQLGWRIVQKDGPWVYLLAP